VLWGEHGRRGASPITELTEIFWDDDKGDDAFLNGETAAYNKSVAFRTRRAVKALIARGLLEDAGSAVNKTGGKRGEVVLGRYAKKGYTRTCRTYRLTPAGRVIADELAEAWNKAQPPELQAHFKELATALEKLQKLAR
jgi:hypothetical protein